MDRDVRDSSAGYSRTDFTLETGLKFRGKVSQTPLSFLGTLTDFTSSDGNVAMGDSANAHLR